MAVSVALAERRARRQTWGRWKRFAGRPYGAWPARPCRAWPIDPAGGGEAARYLHRASAASPDVGIRAVQCRPRAFVAASLSPSLVIASSSRQTPFFIEYKRSQCNKTHPSNAVQCLPARMTIGDWPLPRKGEAVADFSPDWGALLAARPGTDIREPHQYVLIAACRRCPLPPAKNTDQSLRRVPVSHVFSRQRCLTSRHCPAER